MADLNINAQPDMLRGHYANMMQVAHGKEEFILDFLFAHPPQGELVSRVVVSPSHVKRILAALQDNIAKYEQQFGPIA